LAGRSAVRPGRTRVGTRTFGSGGHRLSPCSSIGSSYKGFMIVGCSQCGAKIDRRDENRFFTCPFCRSSLVLEGGRSFACLIMEHDAGDAWIRGLFSERLESVGAAAGPGGPRVVFAYYPFWFIRMDDGTSIVRPAVHMPNPELSSIKVPPGRLKYFDEADPPGAGVVPYTVPLEAVFGGEGERIGSVRHIDLVYLPVYSTRCTHNGIHHTASVVGDGPRVYSTLPSPPGKTSSMRPLVFFGMVLAAMIVASLSVDGILNRAAAVLAVGAAAAILSAVILGPRRSES
jgi:DNA-directed RNA polymerase subunit RPC12/RpoP